MEHERDQASEADGERQVDQQRGGEHADVEGVRRSQRLRSEHDGGKHAGEHPAAADGALRVEDLENQEDDGTDHSREKGGAPIDELAEATTERAHKWKVEHRPAGRVNFVRQATCAGASSAGSYG